MSVTQEPVDTLIKEWQRKIAAATEYPLALNDTLAMKRSGFPLQTPSGVAASRLLRALGAMREAVRFCISLAQNDSNRAYAQDDAAVEKTIGINQTDFDNTIGQEVHAARGCDGALPRGRAESETP